MTAVDDDGPLLSACSQCSKPLSSDDGGWPDTVNLTPDMLMIRCRDFDIGETLIEVDVHFDWCDLTCFGRWLFRAAAYMGSQQLP